jgi:hypothetical protein
MCFHLKSVEFPEGLREIPYQTFKGCDSLEEITIPSTVESIGEWAFEFCRTLRMYICSVMKQGLYQIEKILPLNSIGLKENIFDIKVKKFKEKKCIKLALFSTFRNLYYLISATTTM